MPKGFTTRQMLSRWKATVPLPLTRSNNPEKHMLFFRKTRIITIIAGLAALSACGTTYQVTELSEAHQAEAKAMFAQERNPQTTTTGKRLSPKQAINQFNKVVRRVEPVAENFCRQNSQDRKAFDCDVLIRVDTKAEERNAFQTYNKEGKPLVVFTVPMIADARNEDELAFVMGHEVGHHLAQHIEKQQQQAVAGALILGALAAAGSSPYVDPSVNQANIENAVNLGMKVGNKAFSQTYELESDVIGTYIAKTAGYDPVRGARFFARPENLKSGDGQLSFWGTHPPDEKRIAVVLATVDKMENTGSKTLDRVERKKPTSPD
ncbi:M48 family metallopeptidase [Ruegeria arenilitoris]|uniref:M48 family metallopeptidase n=1 Tax=Ruegeria arenilitoris TaxID=1173585 RepID=UPI00147C0C4A|nr:M48 family metallopeptidase [Ruegeria arenilitoris]